MTKVLSVPVALAFVLVGEVVNAQEPAPITIHIASASVSDAINQWAQQTGFRVVWSDGASTNTTVPQLDGRFLPKQALERLLRKTKLHAEFADAHTAVIEARQARDIASKKKPLRVADVINTSSISDSTTNTPNIDEVIVSSEKHDERLQEVPIPVTSIKGSALVEQNALQIRDYFDMVPGFTMSAVSNQNNQLLVIRGISTGPLSNPTVGVIVDDIPYGGTTLLGGGESVPDIDPGDLVRVEVLRGPQGTLYGANSMGGLIKFVTVDPSTDRLSGHLQAGTSSVSNGAELGYNLRGSLNVPLSDTLAIRASGFTREDPGYIDNPVLHVNGINEERVTGERFAALWMPSDAVSLKLGALYQDTHQNGSSDVNLGPGLGDLQQNYPPGVGGYIQKDQAYSATFTVKSSGFDLTSLSGYNIHQFNDSWDFTPYFASSTLAQFGVPDTPVTVHQAIHKFSQEVRLSGSASQKVDWLIGGFFTHESTTRNEHILAENGLTGAIVGEWADWIAPYKYQEYAAFTNITYHLTDRVDVQVGGREGHLTVTTDPEIDLGVFDPVVFKKPSPIVNPKFVSTANVFTYLLTPRFKISSDVMVYMRLASGYQPGGPNSVLGGGIPTSYAPDTTRNYELGIKGDFLEHALSVDASAYYIQWRDIQISLQTAHTGIGYTGNGSGAKSEGVELSLTLRPLSGLAISGWVSYDDAVLTQDFGPDSPTYGISGDRLPNSSRISGTVSIKQNFPLGRADGFIGAVYNYVGNRFGLFQPITNSARQYYPSYYMAGLQAGVNLETWNATIYANNITDSRGLIGGGIGSFPLTGYSYVTPRTVGLNISKSF